MKLKRTKSKEREMLKAVAKSLYRKGFTLREVADKINRSHSWVAKVIKEKLIK